MRLDRDAAAAGDRGAHRPAARARPGRAAWGIHQLVNENMAAAARMHAVERGKDLARLPALRLRRRRAGARLAGRAGSCAARACSVRSPPACMSAIGLPGRAARLRLRAQPAGQARGDGLGRGQRRCSPRWRRKAARMLRGAGVAERDRSRFAASPTCATGARATRSGCRCPAVVLDPREPGRHPRARSSRPTARSTGTSCPGCAIEVVSWRVVVGRVRARRCARSAAGGTRRGRRRARSRAPRRLHAGGSRASPTSRCTTATAWPPATPSRDRRSSRSASPRPCSARRARARIDDALQPDRRSHRERTERRHGPAHARGAAGTG